jgi:hypothetical protein
MPIFYIPIIFYLIALAIRYRGLTFLSCNPGMRFSGLYGENKAAMLHGLSHRNKEVVPIFVVLDSRESVAEKMAKAERFMLENSLGYPMVIKPDSGQRGQGVAVLRSDQELESYLNQHADKVLLQQHVEGDEFGVFYMCSPDTKQGFIYSITEKTFPIVVGDGVSTLIELLMSSSRTHYMAEYLLELHKNRLELVLAKGENFKVVEIGSHCRGSVFVEASELITPELTEQISEIAQSIDGYYFGRFDIRVPSKEHLKKGQNIKVIEFNGVTSESTNCYDPSYSVFDAYRILFKQWQWAFKIGAKLIEQGEKKRTIAELIKELRMQRAVA